MSTNAIQFYANVPLGTGTVTLTINGPDKPEGAHFDALRDFLDLMRREHGKRTGEVPANAPSLRVELDRYKRAIDAIYNHNEAARAAVIQHFGLVHPSGPAEDTTQGKESLEGLEP